MPKASKKLKQAKDKAGVERFTKEKKAAEKKQSSVPLEAVYLAATDQDEAREKLASEEELSTRAKSHQKWRKMAGKEERERLLHMRCTNSLSHQAKPSSRDRGAEQRALEDGFAWWLKELLAHALKPELRIFGCMGQLRPRPLRHARKADAKRRGAKKRRRCRGPRVW